MIDEGIEKTERIANQSDFEAFLAENGFQHRSKGTYFSEEQQAFLYRKREAYFSTREIAIQARETYRQLTSRGVLHPETTWHIYQRENGNFVVYAISPKLSQDQDYFKDKRWQVGPIKKYELLAARLGFDSKDVIDDAIKDDESILNHLDPVEIQSRQNWGYDPDLDEFYVIDVQAVMFDGADQYREDHQRAIEIEQAEIDTSILRF